MAKTFKRDFKVIIIGAGISGLTFAHLLSQMGLDYQILEAHEKVVSEVGGSFGIWPNAARILDQLGLWNEVQQVCKPIKFLHVRRPDGSLGSSTNLSSSIASEYVSIILKCFSGDIITTIDTATNAMLSNDISMSKFYTTIFRRNMKF